jgi:hypothetical protein
MRKLATIPQIAVVLFAAAIVASAQSDWKGSYVFTENGGKNAAGVAIVITHQIDVFEGGEGLAASIQSNGYQTSADLICSVKVQGTKLMIYFESYGEDNMFEPYNQGDLLLTLERKGKQLLTHWGKFSASIEKNERSGKPYFEKMVQKKQ